jgi:hypothetical protein
VTISVDQDGTIVLEKVFLGILLQTEAGEQFGICMRDSGFEFKYMGEWWEAKEGIVKMMNPAKKLLGDEALKQGNKLD